MRSRRAVPLLLVSLFAAQPVAAQRAASRLDSLDFSGVFLANYQYHADTGVARGSNKFDVERIYLTFRMPVGERLGIRVTTDIFQAQSTDGTVKGWLLRAKFAYLQYDFGKKDGFRGLARFGIVPTVIVDHEEAFWPRFISPVEMDRSGLISPADGGIATVVQLPGSRGELFAGITNGPGYTGRETDRFKDYAARLSLTPLSDRSDWLKNFTLTGWIYRGSIGSKFSSGGVGQLGRVGGAMPKTGGACSLVRATRGSLPAPTMAEWMTHPNQARIPRPLPEFGTTVPADSRVRSLPSNRHFSCRLPRRARLESSSVTTISRPAAWEMSAIVCSSVA